MPTTASIDSVIPPLLPTKHVSNPVNKCNEGAAQRVWAFSSRPAYEVHAFHASMSSARMVNLQPQAGAIATRPYNTTDREKSAVQNAVIQAVRAFDRWSVGSGSSLLPQALLRYAA